MTSSDHTHWRAFLLIACTFSGPFKLAIPPFNGPDEPAQLYRTFEVSRLHLLPRSSPTLIVPAAMWERANQFAYQKAADSKVKVSPREVIAALRSTDAMQPTKVIPSTGVGMYSFVPYVPGAIGLRIAEWFWPNVVFELYAVRVFSATAGIFLLVLALWCAPAGKYLLLFLSLAPMTVFLLSVATADTVTIGLAALTAAEALRHANSPTQGGPWKLAVTAGALSLCKPGYALLPLCFVRKSRTALILLGVAVVGVGLSMFYAHDGFLARDPSVDPASQIRVIASNPAHGIGVLLRDAVVHAPRYAYHIAGRFGWLETPLPIWAVAVWYALFALALTSESVTISLQSRLLTVSIAFATGFGILLSQYLLWTPVGSNEVIGVQGRYFLPILPFVSIAIAPKHGVPRLSKVILPGSCFLLAVSLVVFLRRYYG